GGQRALPREADGRRSRPHPRRLEVRSDMAVGPAPQEHNVVYSTLHFDQPWSYENYLKAGGYQAWRKILTEKISQEDVSNMVKTSGLRGRGGAGFPAGLKW